MNQLSVVNIFCPFATNYRKSSAIFKKLARSTPVSFDRRDRRAPARLPRSNEATARVNKGQAAQPAYAGLTNEVVPMRSRDGVVITLGENAAFLHKPSVANENETEKGQHF